jgi:hypothetical protein
MSELSVRPRHPGGPERRSAPRNGPSTKECPKRDGTDQPRLVRGRLGRPSIGLITRCATARRAQHTYVISSRLDTFVPRLSCCLKAEILTRK